MHSVFKHIVQTNLLVAVTGILITAPALAAKKTRPSDDGKNGMKRPGSLQIIDNSGGAGLTDGNVGVPASIKYWYGPFAGPDNPPNMALTNTDRGVWEGTGLTKGPGSPASWAVATKTRHMGIYYQSNGDKKNASSATTMFKYRVKVDEMIAGYYKNILDITHPDASCKIELTFPNVSSGSAPSPLQVEVTTNDGLILSGSAGYGHISFNWAVGSGWGTATGGTYNVSISNPGNWNGAPHTAKSELQSTSVVGSRGKIMIEEVNTARAWGSLSWSLFTETGSKQIPLRFPAPAGSLTAIRFNQ